MVPRGGRSGETIQNGGMGGQVTRTHHRPVLSHPTSFLQSPFYFSSLGPVPLVCIAAFDGFKQGGGPHLGQGPKYFLVYGPTPLSVALDTPSKIFILARVNQKERHVLLLCYNSHCAPGINDRKTLATGSKAWRISKPLQQFPFHPTRLRYLPM